MYILSERRDGRLVPQDEVVSRVGMIDGRNGVENHRAEGVAGGLDEHGLQDVEGGDILHRSTWNILVEIIIIMVLFYLFIQYYAVLKEISIR